MPGAQAEHCAMPAAPLVSVPAAQAVQAVAPASLYEFTPQSAQLEEELLALYCPALH